MNAQPWIYLEECAVAAALNKGQVAIEKLVFLPFQVDAGVWATVDEGVEFTILMDDKNFDSIAFIAQLESFAARVGDVWNSA